MFGSLKWIAIAGVTASILAGLWYISNLQANLAISEENNKKLTTAVQDQQVLIDNQVKDIESIQNTMVAINEQRIELQNKLNELDEKFNISANGTSRDFGKITRAKPSLINKIIDKATDNANRCFELATGSPIKEGEKNSECQDLISTN